MKTKKIGLILQGGGSKGAYQVGSLIAISEIIKDLTKDINPFYSISGMSVGSINACFLSSIDNNFEKEMINLKNKWLKLNNEEIYDLGKYGIFSSLSNVFNDEINSLFSLEPLSKFLEKEIDFNKIEFNSKNDKRYLNVHSYSYDRSDNFIFSNNMKDVSKVINTIIDKKHILASCSVPYVFKESIINNERFGDGGLSIKTPSKILINHGCQKILSLSLSFNKSKSIADNLFDVIFPNPVPVDFSIIEKKNSNINKYNPFEKNSYIDTLEIRPEIENVEIHPDTSSMLPKSLKIFSKIIGLSNEENNSILNYIIFETDYIEYLIEKGYHETIKKADEIFHFFK